MLIILFVIISESKCTGLFSSVMFEASQITLTYLVVFTSIMSPSLFVYLPVNVTALVWFSFSKFKLFPSLANVIGINNDSPRPETVLSKLRFVPVCYFEVCISK